MTWTWFHRLASPPHAYRSSRTDGWREVVDRIGEERLYRTTGIQLMQINTIFQLAAHDRQVEPEPDVRPVAGDRVLQHRLRALHVARGHRLHGRPVRIRRIAAHAAASLRFCRIPRESP